MQRLAAIGLLLIAFASEIALLSDQEKAASIPSRVINVLPEAVPPVDDAQLDALLNQAEITALVNGLESVSVQYYMWTTRGEWNAAQGMVTFDDPSTPLLIISMPGVGFWTGPGASHIDELVPIDGITLAYTPLDGSFAGAVGSFMVLPLNTEGVTVPGFNFPTQVPF
jgi:hypothetical protein